MSTQVTEEEINDTETKLRAAMRGMADGMAAIAGAVVPQPPPVGISAAGVMMGAAAGSMAGVGKKLLEKKIADAAEAQAAFNAAAEQVLVAIGKMAEDIVLEEEQLERQRSPALLRDLPVRSQPLVVSKKGAQL